MARVTDGRAKQIGAAVACQDLPALQRALAGDRALVPAAAVVNAGRLAWLPGLKLLARHGADLNAIARNYRAIHALIQERPHEPVGKTAELPAARRAALAARVTCLEWLLAHGADPEAMAAWPSARALVIAAFVGEPAYVRVLRRAGARLDIFTASALGDARRVSGMLAREPGLAAARDGRLLTALQCAGGSRLGARNKMTARGLLECARLLVDAGADVNAATKSWGHDVTVSYFVIRSGQIEALKMLLDHGLDPTAAVAACAWDGREDMLDLLLAHGADLSRAVDHARPVLNELIRWGRFMPARLLLAKGANPNVTDDRGWTALHQAASRGNVRMVADLLAAGANPDGRDRSGRRPMDVARAAIVVRALKAHVSGR